MDPEFAERLKRALRVLNGLEDKPTTERDEQLVPGDLVRLSHVGKEGSVPIDPEHESQGTLVWVSMVGPVLDVLRRGSIVLVRRARREPASPTLYSGSSGSSRLPRQTPGARNSFSTPTIRPFLETAANATSAEIRSGSPRKMPTAGRRYTRWRIFSRSATKRSEDATCRGVTEPFPCWTRRSSNWSPMRPGHDKAFRPVPATPPCPAENAAHLPGPHRRAR